jgi:hypothetical protein
MKFIRKLFGKTSTKITRVNNNATAQREAYLSDTVAGKNHGLRSGLISLENAQAKEDARLANLTSYRVNGNANRQREAYENPQKGVFGFTPVRSKLISLKDAQRNFAGIGGSKRKSRKTKKSRKSSKSKKSKRTRRH